MVSTDMPSLTHPDAFVLAVSQMSLLQINTAKEEKRGVVLSLHLVRDTDKKSTHNINRSYSTITKLRVASTLASSTGHQSHW
jgi:hypothetical protein